MKRTLPKEFIEEDGIPKKKLKTEDIKELIEEAENVEIQKMTKEGVQHLLEKVKESLKKNMELRSKYINEPSKFIDSEVELAMELKNLQNITAYPDLGAFFLSLKGPKLIVDCLLHENMDICKETINILIELTELDFVNSNKNNLEITKELLNLKVIEAIGSYILKIEETKLEESDMIFSALTCLEQLMDINEESCHRIMHFHELIEYISKRAVKDEELSQNKIYCSELLAIVIQNSPHGRKKFGEINSLEKFLKVLIQEKYREKFSLDDIEYVGNIFNIICSILLEEENKETFLKLNGIEISVKFFDCHQLRLNTIKLLDVAIMNKPESCKSFINSNGLKYIFPFLILKGIKFEDEEQLKDTEEHLLSILFALFFNCTSVEYDRLIYKFKEENCTKIYRIVDLHNKYRGALLSYKEKIKESKENNEESKEDIHDLMLKEGLFPLELADLCIISLINSKQSDIIEKINTEIKNGQILLEEVFDTCNLYMSHMEEGNNTINEKIKEIILTAKTQTESYDPNENQK